MFVFGEKGDQREEARHHWEADDKDASKGARNRVGAWHRRGARGGQKITNMQREPTEEGGKNLGKNSHAKFRPAVEEGVDGITQKGASVLEKENIKRERENKTNSLFFWGYGFCGFLVWGGWGGVGGSGRFLTRPCPRADSPFHPQRRRGGNKRTKVDHCLGGTAVATWSGGN